MSKDRECAEPTPEMTVLGWFWGVGLVVVACWAGPGWAVVLLAATVAGCAAHAVCLHHRVEVLGRRMRQANADTGVPPWVRDVRVSFLEVQRDEAAAEGYPVVFPERELTRHRRMLRSVAKAVISAVTMTMAFVVYGALLLAPSAVLVVVGWWCAGVVAGVAVGATVPWTVLLIVRRLPTPRDLCQEIRAQIMWISPFA